MEEKLDKIIELLENNNNEDGTVTFKFDINDRMVYAFCNLDKIMNGLEKIQDLRRKLYKYGLNSELYYNKETKDTKLRAEMELTESLGKGYTAYVPINEMIDELDNVLDELYEIIEKYMY